MTLALIVAVICAGAAGYMFGIVHACWILGKRGTQEVPEERLSSIRLIKLFPSQVDELEKAAAKEPKARQDN